MSKHKGLQFLVRHGAAEDRHALGDDARALTAEGRTELRKLARELSSELELTAIATSPLVRAVQTAEILAEACGVRDIVVRGELSVDGASAAGIESPAARAGRGMGARGAQPVHGRGARADPGPAGRAQLPQGGDRGVDPGAQGGARLGDLARAQAAEHAGELPACAP